MFSVGRLRAKAGLLAVSLSIGCAGDAHDAHDESCVSERVEASARADLGDATIRDCGVFDGLITEEREGDNYPRFPELEAAHACVIEAVAAGEPFLVVWSPPCIDCSYRTAYAGLDTERGYEVRLYSGSASFDDPFAIRRSVCSSLAANVPPDGIDDCFEIDINLCLSCDSEPSETLCD